MPIEDIVNFYPEIIATDVYACLAFASEAVKKVKPTKKIGYNLSLEEEKKRNELREKLLGSGLSAEEEKRKNELREKLFGENGKYKNFFNDRRDSLYFFSFAS